MLEAHSGSPEDAEYAERRAAAQQAFDKLEKSIIRERIAVHKKRPDGRKETEIRDITIEASVLPRAHGSALFTRGQTQALSVVALGTLKEEMRLDTLGLETQQVLLAPLQLPAVLGRRGRAPCGGPKRRDIGHGALAERALVPMIPSIEDVPVHDPRRLGHPRVQRLVVDGVGLRLVAVADGRRRADQGARSPGSRWA